MLEVDPTEIGVEVQIVQVREANLVPGLATPWSATDDTTWKHELRQGVTYHDGSPYGADDVAFSLDHMFGF